MANSYYTNPIVLDTTDTTVDGWTPVAGKSVTKYVKLAQWIDDAGDIAADDILILTVNGTTITAKVAAIDTTVSTTHWQFGPFDKGVPWTDLGATIPHGILVIWLE